MKSGVLQCRVLWLGIFSEVLNLGSFAMVLSILMKWIGDLPESYIVNTVQGVVGNIIEAGGVTLITWASDPSRLGRRNAYIILCSCTPAVLLPCWFSGGGESGAVAYLAIKTLFSAIGGSNPQAGAFSVLCAWVADYLPEEHLTAGFSLLLGAQFLTMGAFPMLVLLVRRFLPLTDIQLVLFAAVVGALPIPMLIFCSPQAGQPEQALPAPRDVNRNNARSSSVMKDVCAALRWLFRERLAVIIVWICINFYAAADSSNIMLYLVKGLKFDEAEANGVLSSIGIFGCIITFFVVPGLSKIISRGSIIFVGVICSLGHCLVYGLVTSASIITALGFLGSMSYSCIPTLLSYTKGADVRGCSHGTALGTFNGVASIAKIVGPPLLAVCLQSFLDHRGLCFVNGLPNFVGSGFVVVSTALIPALLASICLVIQEWRARGVVVRGEGGGWEGACGSLHDQQTS